MKFSFFLLISCFVFSVQSPAQTPPQAPEQMADPALQTAPAGEAYNYDPTGKRDPFKPYGGSQATKAPELAPAPEAPKKPTVPLESYDIAQFKLVGVVWNVRDPKAMIQDPTGKLHMVRKETKIGRNNGFVAAIREGEVIVVEPTVSEGGMQTAVTRVLNLNR